jgi:hypothetical protein
MKLRNKVSICTLIIGLICPFTQVARGQQPGPVKPPPSAMIVERPDSSERERERERGIGWVRIEYDG